MRYRNDKIKLMQDIGNMYSERSKSNDISPELSKKFLDKADKIGKSITKTKQRQIKTLKSQNARFAKAAAAEKVRREREESKALWEEMKRYAANTPPPLPKQRTPSNMPTTPGVYRITNDKNFIRKR